MWELNDYWGNDQEVHQNSMVSPITIFPSDVHVLLVDHDRETLASLTNMLQLNSYKVTVIELASKGLAMLTEGGEQFEVVIVNVSSPDFQGFRLLEAAVDRGKAAFLISANEDLVLATRAIQRGACMCVEKPVSIEFVKYLWQHVLKHRIKINNAAAAAKKSSRKGNGENGSTEEGLPEEDDHMDNNNNSDVEITINNSGPENKRKRKERYHQDVPELNAAMNINDDNKPSAHVKKKACTEWTRELHAKFMDAVIKLGEGRCYPKDILIKMNVPGLTRMQVASHLQKCRNENWRIPERRRGQGGRSRSNAAVSLLKADGFRRFGKMPRSCEHFHPQEQPNNKNNNNNQEKSGFHKLNIPGVEIENEEPNGQQTVDDYYSEFTDMDYIAENITYLREGSADPDQTQCQPAAAAAYGHNQVCPDQQVAMGMEIDTKWLQYGPRSPPNGGSH